MDSLTFYIFLFIHLISLIVGFGAVLITDFFGLLWLRKQVSTKFMVEASGWAKTLIWLGWFGLVFSGLVLLTQKGYVDNLTQIKLFFVAMIGANGVFLHKIHIALERLGNANMSSRLKFRIVVASIISQVGWWGAIFIGFIHRHWRHNISWPDNPWLYMAIIGGAFMALLLIGELIFGKTARKKNE